MFIVSSVIVVENIEFCLAEAGNFKESFRKCRHVSGDLHPLWPLVEHYPNVTKGLIEHPETNGGTDARRHVSPRLRTYRSKVRLLTTSDFRPRSIQERDAPSRHGDALRHSDPTESTVSRLPRSGPYCKNLGGWIRFEGKASPPYNYYVVDIVIISCQSYPRLIATLAPQVTIDYTGVNPAWGQKTYDKEVFAKLWMSEEHLGNPVLGTQHLLGLPYFSYVGSRRTEKAETNGKADSGQYQREDVQEIEVNWQLLASHARQEKSSSPGSNGPPRIEQTSDHRAHMTHVFIKADEDGNGRSPRSQWKLTSIKPEPIYMEGDFERTRRAADAP